MYVKFTIQQLYMLTYKTGQEDRQGHNRAEGHVSLTVNHPEPRYRTYTPGRQSHSPYNTLAPTA